uniref:Uncharacterized protein n=1 Tax=Meloidogyne enterolobii TaxID=390850 RepID=A0A6V7WBG0_MELEN|nr:unnamed protein product [Meloidogyne enterolobii]
MNFTEKAFPNEENKGIKSANNKIIENWEGKECEDENEIEDKFFKQRKDFQNFNLHYLQTFPEKMKDITSVPGTKSKLEYLFPNILLDPLIEDENLFSRDDLLVANYLGYISTKNSLIENISNKSAINLIVWARWMENEFKIKSRESIIIYRLFEIWKERKINLKAKYDKIMNFELKRIEEIKKEENYLVEMEFGLKKLVEDEMESEENFFDIGNLIKQNG